MAQFNCASGANCATHKPWSFNGMTQIHSWHSSIAIAPDQVVETESTSAKEGTSAPDKVMRYCCGNCANRVSALSRTDLSMPRRRQLAQQDRATCVGAVQGTRRWSAAGLREPAARCAAARAMVLAPRGLDQTERQTSMEDASSAAQGVPDPSSAPCPCGAGAHAADAGRCAAGHLVRGNTAAVVTGMQSAAFWREHAAARREIAEAIITDAGHDAASAPRALALAADSIAQATLIRDATYLLMVEACGPLTPTGRVRRAFNVWSSAADRLERNLRLVGLERRSKALPTATEIMAESAERQE